jgi:hypothetical protein
VSILFAAFLGYNPIQHLLGPHVLATLSVHSQAVLTGHSFFPHVISAPFRDGLHATFIFAIAACLIAAGASLVRDRRAPADDNSQPVFTVGRGAQPLSRNVQGPPQAALSPERESTNKAV